MAWKELEPDDPFDMVAVPVTDTGEDAEAMEEMALAFALEFVSMGWSDKTIARLFRQPFYRGPYQVYRLKGADFVDEVIRRARQEHQARVQRFRREGPGPEVKEDA